MFHCVRRPAVQRRRLPSFELSFGSIPSRPVFCQVQWRTPELELSNNLAENSMRPVALGRKNWIHIGSQQAGPKVAAILSIVETCRRINIPVRDYLAAVPLGLANTSIQRLAQLTPAA